MEPLLAWKRVRSALFHFARERSIDRKRVNAVMQVLPALIAMCGPFSHSRHVAREIGKVLLLKPKPEILVPLCPAYTYRQGKYTYRGLGEGVPLLAKVHIPFLKQVQTLLIGTHVRLLLADQEALVPELCQAFQIDSGEFLHRVHNSVIATRRLVEPFGWEVDAMTTYLPRLRWEVELIGRGLVKDHRNKSVLRAETLARQRVYDLIGYRRTQHFARTVQTAAQYVYLGTVAKFSRSLICNHSTQNLAWYARTDVGFLHNPVRVYDVEEPEVPPELME